MALIQCKECGKKISEFCGVCPNCGCPVESHSTETVNEAVDQPDTETASEPKKTKLTYIQKRNQHIIRIVSAVILVVVGIGLIDSASENKDRIEADVVREWYYDALGGRTEDGTFGDVFQEWFIDILEDHTEDNTFHDVISEYLKEAGVRDANAFGFETYLKEEKLSGKIFMRQLPYYIGSVGCFALAGYLLISLKKYPLVKRD